MCGIFFFNDAGYNESDFKALEAAFIAGSGRGPEKSSLDYVGNNLFLVRRSTFTLPMLGKKSRTSLIVELLLNYSCNHYKLKKGSKTSKKEVIIMK